VDRAVRTSMLGADLPLLTHGVSSDDSQASEVVYRCPTWSRREDQAVDFDR
jgi:hypothetical protein